VNAAGAESVRCRAAVTPSGTYLTQFGDLADRTKVQVYIAEIIPRFSGNHVSAKPQPDLVSLNTRSFFSRAAITGSMFKFLRRRPISWKAC
jgi:hypothetical protein